MQQRRCRTAWRSVFKTFHPEHEGRWKCQVTCTDLGPSGHVDDFARRNLPPPEQWPELLLDRPEFQYPDYLNAAVELTDRMVEKGFGDHVALIGNGRQRTYKELTDWSNRLAHALVENYGVKPGNRVLIRSGNNPALVAAWLAATKAGAVVVNTMPMLRAGELTKIVDKAEIELALTDSRIADELVACAKTSRFLKQVVNFDGTSNHDAELDRVALNKPVRFDAVKTGRDDVALLGFTSGTTGEPKATMHFHRDLLIVADGYAQGSAASHARTTSSSARRRWLLRSASAASRSFRCGSAPPRRCWKTLHPARSSRSSKPTRRRSASPRRPRTVR